MKRKRKTPNSKRNVANYVMFGFNKDNIDETGYLGKNDADEFLIVQDIHDALLFPNENIKAERGFGTPEQWLDFWNNEPFNQYKFHLVKTCLQ